MSVDAATVRRIAHLARIAVADDEVEHLRGELNAILDFVDQLSEVNVDGIEPMTSVTPMEMKKRLDVVTDGGMCPTLAANPCWRSYINEYAAMAACFAHRSRCDPSGTSGDPSECGQWTDASKAVCLWADGTELDRMGGYLNESLRGRTLEQARRWIEEQLKEDRANYDRFMRAALILGGSIAASAPTELYVNGSSKALEQPEFADPNRMRELLRALEDRTALLDLLERSLSHTGPMISIGSENFDARLAGFSPRSRSTTPSAS